MVWMSLQKDAFGYALRGAKIVKKAMFIISLPWFDELFVDLIGI